MQTEQIVGLLVAERDRLQKAIDALGGTQKSAPKAAPIAARKKAVKSAAPKPVAPAKAPAKGKRTLSAAARKAMADAAKRRWAAIKAGKATNPFTKVKAKVASKS